MRSYVGSLDGLIAMYHGEADIVSTHLLDGDTLEYNIPYIKKVLVSSSFIVTNLVSRTAGLYAAKGNPKSLTSWSDFSRDELRMINREQGSGARVLLDEQLRLHRISKEQIRGYEDEESSHLGVAGVVAKGEIDIGVGIEKVAAFAGIDFIPLITESYDLVILKTRQNTELLRAVQAIISSSQFKEELASIGYDVSRTGTVLYEQ